MSLTHSLSWKQTRSTRAARVGIVAAALTLGAASWLIIESVAPSIDPRVLCLLGLAPVIFGGALAVSLEERGIAALLPIIAGCAIAAMLAPLLIHDAGQMATVFGFGSLYLMLAGAYSLAKTARWRLDSRTREALAVWLASIFALGLYCVYYVIASRDLMFGDFMYRRVEAIIVASMLDSGQFVDLVRSFVDSMKDEYSLLPVLAPGVALAATSPSSRVVYQGAVVVLYAAPAYLALGALARDLAWRAGLDRSVATRRLPVLALAVCAVFAAYPTGIAVVARGMPDIGGLVLVVAALRLSDRLARLLALRPGHDHHIWRLTRRVTLALALCLFGMFLFRRWYAFAAVGVVAALGGEIALLAAKGGAKFRWRDATSAASLGGLIILGLCAPILIDWLPDPGAHDYVTIYAAYKKAFTVVIAEIFDWYGAALLAGSVCGAIFLGLRAGDRRLLRMTCASCLIAALLFLRVQSPAIHHVYLLTPAFVACIGAPLLIAFERRRLFGLLMLTALAAFTLTPAVSSWAPRGFAPTAGQPPQPRTDLAELARLKAWVDADATPDHRICVIASSYTINDAIVDELWQMKPGGLPLIAEEARRPSIGMPHVDTRDGPPTSKLKDCATILVGDPVQTHLVPAYQQNVILPASEMLAGEGIGANYRRTGEVFNLEKGVKLVAFERVRPLDDDEIAALQARWRAVRAGEAAGLRGTSSD